MYCYMRPSNYISNVIVQSLVKLSFILLALFLLLLLFRYPASASLVLSNAWDYLFSYIDSK